MSKTTAHLAPPTEQQIAVRRKLIDDFEYYAQSVIKIRTKSGQLEPLRFNAVQRRFVEAITKQFQETGRIRVVVLKARQQGFSTIVSAWNYWKLSQTAGRMGLIVANDTETTRTIYGMYRNIHENMPTLPANIFPLKPRTGTANRNQMMFDDIRSGFLVRTAGANSVARGSTLHSCHLTECAFWKPQNLAYDNYTALTQAVPDQDDTAIFVESTANGQAGLFYDLYQGAAGNRNGYLAFFAPWFETPEYAKPFDGFELTIEENALKTIHGLSSDQLQWRRDKIAEIGRTKFEQEYPATPSEAFKASGSPVFDLDIVNKLLCSAPAAPLYQMAMCPETERTFVKSLVGELSVYHEHDRGQIYTIGADIAFGGSRADYSVAQVLDGDLRQVAVWRGKCSPEHFGTILSALGYYYNEALVAAESNSYGYATNLRLKDLCYPMIYTMVNDQNLIDNPTYKLGFRTTRQTKATMIARLNTELQMGRIEINHNETLMEMRTFAFDESGQMKASGKNHDDCVMSLAIANHVHRRRWTPVEMPDNLYVEAI